MREPTRDEMQIAIILLEEMTLSVDARAVLNRIVAGELVQTEGLVRQLTGPRCSAAPTPHAPKPST